MSVVAVCVDDMCGVEKWDGSASQAEGLKPQKRLGCRWLHVCVVAALQSVLREDDSALSAVLLLNNSLLFPIPPCRIRAMGRE